MKRYEHVIVMGIDGAGAFFKDADTPHFDRIFADGAVTYTALSSNPTISAECWGSMLLGVGPEVHKLNNGIVMSKPYPVDSAYPSLFRRIRKEMPEAALGSFCDWNPITNGIVENNLRVTSASARDELLTPQICEYIRREKPTFLFVQFDSVDYVGHMAGYGSKEHLQRIREVDELIGDVFETVEQSGMAEETLFMLSADHGGTPFNGTGASHGGWTDAEKLVTFAARGRGVKKGTVEAMNIRDLAAIVLYALGIEAPAFDEQGWTSQIPTGLFADADLPEYRDISHLTGAAPRRSDTQHTSEPVETKKASP